MPSLWSFLKTLGITLTHPNPNPNPNPKVNPDPNRNPNRNPNPNLALTLTLTAFSALARRHRPLHARVAQAARRAPRLERLDHAPERRQSRGGRMGERGPILSRPALQVYPDLARRHQAAGHGGGVVQGGVHFVPDAHFLPALHPDHQG